MAAGAYPLRIVQFGLEAGAGTLVAATAKRIGRAVFTPNIQRHYDGFPRGVFLPDEGGGVIVGKGGTFVYEGDLTYEEIVYPLICGLQNDAVPDGAGPYTWQPFRTWTAAPTLKSATIEFVVDDGSTKHYQREAGYGTCRQFSISAQAGQNAPAQIREEWFTRAEQTSTMTAGLTAISGRSVVPGDLFKIWIDGAWANLGTTAKTGLLRGFELTVIPGAEPDFTLDGRSDLDYTGLRYAIASAVLRLTMRHNADGATEVDALRAGTERAVRLKATDGTKSVQIDIAGFYRGDPQFDNDGDVENVTLDLHADYEAAGTDGLKITVVNQLATQP